MRNRPYPVLKCSRPEDSALAILPPKTGFCMRRLERDSCPSLLILTLLFRFCLLDLILPVPFPRTQRLRAGFLAQLPFLPSRSDSDRPILAFSDSVARLRFLPPDARKRIFLRPAGFLHLGSPAGLSIPDSCFCPSRGGSPRPAGRLCGTNHAHVYALYPPRHPLCYRNALRAPHSTAVTFERRLITRASESPPMDAGQRRRRP